MDVRTKNRFIPAPPVMGSNFLTPSNPGLRVRNVHRKFRPNNLFLCCFPFPAFGFLLTGGAFLLYRGKVRLIAPEWTVSKETNCKQKSCNCKSKKPPPANSGHKSGVRKRMVFHRRMFPRNGNQKFRKEGTFACSPGTKTGTRAHSPKPPFYETAFLSPLE